MTTSVQKERKEANGLSDKEDSSSSSRVGVVVIKSPLVENNKLNNRFQQPSEQPQIKKKSLVEFECDLCGRKYKFENFLKVHQRRPCT